LTINNADISDGPDDYNHSFIIDGITTLSGIPTKISMLYAPVLPRTAKDEGVAGSKKGGISFTIEIPRTLSVAALFPRLRALGKTVLTNRRLIISDFEHNDSMIDHKIAPGLALIGDIEGFLYVLEDGLNVRQIRIGYPR